MHEETYRNKSLKELTNKQFVIFGAGALGGNLALNLSDLGCSNITIIDKDRVEDSNRSTQPYGIKHIGIPKTTAIAAIIYTKNGEKTTAIKEEVTIKNVKKFFIKNALHIDCFDNSLSRKILFDYAQENKFELLHAGLYGSYGEVKWNSVYVVPQDTKGLDVCEYPLSKTAINITVALLQESIIKYTLDSEKCNYIISVGENPNIRKY